MRIAGYIDHPVFKITVFKTDTRLSIKFENGDFEQTYKFRPSEQTNSVNEIRKLIDDTFLERVSQRFGDMAQDLNASFERHYPQDTTDDLPSIL